MPLYRNRSVWREDIFSCLLLLLLRERSAARALAIAACEGLVAVVVVVDEDEVEESVPARGGAENVGVGVSSSVRDEVEVCAVCDVKVVTLELREGETLRGVY